VVGRAAAGDILGLTMVKLVGSSTDLVGLNYAPCNGAKSLVFTVLKGKVIYLGDVHYTAGDRGIVMNYFYRFEPARSYVNANFPALKGRVESIDVEQLPIRARCTG